LQFLTTLADLLSEILSRTGLGLYFSRETASDGLDPEQLKPTGPDISLGPRAESVPVRHGQQRLLLKRWHDLEPDSRRDLARQLEARRTLVGPRYLAIHQVGEKLQDRRTGYVYCIQDLRPRSLAQYLLELGGQCPLDEATRIIRTVAEALADGHARGLVHGNLSPDAVFVESAAGSGAGQVCLDYARSTGVSTGSDAALTVMDLFPQGRAYLPPEALMGNPPDDLSDLFTLGILAYEVFTGKRPFGGEGASTMQKVKTLLAAQVDPPGRFRPDLPNRWEAAILQLLRKEPRLRYRDARKFLDAVTGG